MHLTLTLVSAELTTFGTGESVCHIFVHRPEKNRLKENNGGKVSAIA